MVFQSQQQFKFAKTWTAEVSGWYRTKGLEGVLFIKPLGAMDLGLSKQIMKSKGTLKMNLNDVFNTMNFKGYSKYSNVDAQFQNYNKARAISVSFTYRFNKGKLNANSGRRNSGASDEQNRVKTGK
jgi:hypothetical protein